MFITAALFCFICTGLLGWFLTRKAIHSAYGSFIIFLPFALGMFLVNRENYTTLSLLIGGALIVSAEVLSNKKRLSGWWMLSGQTAAGLIVIILGKVELSFMNTYFGETIYFYGLSFPLTLLFLISVTNSLHLQRQTNTLVTGLAAIVLIVITSLSLIIGDMAAAKTGVLLVIGVVAFLLSNSGEKAASGSTGSSLIGFIIAVILLSGFKGIEIIYIPFYLIGVPILIYSMLIQRGADTKQSINISLIAATFFGLPLFFLSPAVIWGAVILAALLFILNPILSFKRLYR
jgi:UDP-GlcNAc:undecaprenyl-phosphate/decaprenyl-phosphate GlcNAc-1-phosphate transferase